MWRFVAAVYQKACICSPTSVLCSYKVMLQCAARTAACSDCQAATRHVTNANTNNHPTSACCLTFTCSKRNNTELVCAVCYCAMTDGQWYHTNVTTKGNTLCNRPNNRMTGMLRDICELLNNQVSATCRATLLLSEHQDPASYAFPLSCSTQQRTGCLDNLLLGSRVRTQGA